MDTIFIRRARRADIDRLHGMMSIPEVYHYLADNTEPPRAAIEAWLTSSDQSFDSHGVGLWLLESGNPSPAGCVLLEVAALERGAELTCALAPHFWGQGLATRMCLTVVRHAFASEHLDRIIAGADVPNEASIALMRRIGMRFLRDVSNPLHPGVEYELRRGDLPAEAAGHEIPIR